MHRYRHLYIHLTQGLGKGPWLSHRSVGSTQEKGEPRERWMSPSPELLGDKKSVKETEDVSQGRVWMYKCKRRVKGSSDVTVSPGEGDQGSEKYLVDIASWVTCSCVWILNWRELLMDDPEGYLSPRPGMVAVHGLLASFPHCSQNTFCYLYISGNPTHFSCVRQTSVHHIARTRGVSVFLSLWEKEWWAWLHTEILASQ